MKKNNLLRGLLMMFAAFLVCGCGKKESTSKEQSAFVKNASDVNYNYALYTDHVEIVSYIGESLTPTIPEEFEGQSVTKIGIGAFQKTKITQITIPDNIVSVGPMAFYDCNNLKNITLSEGMTEISSSMFNECDHLESIVFGKNIVNIGSEAFFACQSLSSVTMNEGLLTIDDSAFSSCYALTEIQIPDSVTTIGNAAFAGCPFTDVVLGDNVTTLGSAFWNCEQLVSVKLPANITKIENNTFEGCTSLKNISIPEKVTVLGEESFKDCTNLKSIYIPGSVSEIQDKAFQYAENLVISCHKDSYAESYAKENSMKCSVIEEATMPLTVYQHYYEGPKSDGMIGVLWTFYFDEATGLSQDSNAYFMYEDAAKAKAVYEERFEGNEESRHELQETVISEWGVPEERSLLGETRVGILENFEGWATYNGEILPVNRSGNNPITVYGRFSPGQRKDGLLEIWQVMYFDDQTKCMQVDSLSIYENEEIAQESYEYYQNDFYEKGKEPELEIQGNMLYSKGITSGYSMFGETRADLIPDYEGWLMLFEGAVMPEF